MKKLTDSQIRQMIADLNMRMDAIDCFDSINLEDCKIKRLSDPKKFIESAARLLSEVSLKCEIPDDLQIEIDYWLKSFTSGEIKKWRGK